jgi:hypothetical protein
MGFLRSSCAGGAALLLVAACLGPASRAAGQGAIAVPLVVKSVHGKLDTLDKQRSGIFVVSDDGRRMAWRLEEGVIDRLTGFKKGDPIVVIYRQRGGGDKAVTAVAFPGAAATPVYINTTGRRIEFISGPKVNGVCGEMGDAPLNHTTVPVDGMAEVSDECWCCAPAGEACAPANKTGLGKAFLTQCYK